MDKKKTGNLIKEARTKKGYTQQELGDMVGVTNKAISRWENGEAFPDVSLLDTLSTALGVGIEELVLGEKKEKAEDKVALEIVQLARMEKNRKNRLAEKQYILSAVYFLLIILGIEIVLNGLRAWPVQIIYYACLLSVLLLGIFDVKNKILEFSLKERKHRVLTVISVVSVLYSILLVCGTLGLHLKGTNIFNLKTEQMGPFMDYQLLIIFLLNAILVAVFALIPIVKENRICVGIYSALAGCFLSLAYSDLLFRLASPEHFIGIFLLDTAVIIGIVIAGLVIALILNKKLKTK